MPQIDENNNRIRPKKNRHKLSAADSPAMALHPEKAPNARTEIDWDKLDDLCRHWMTQNECAFLMGTSMDSISRRIRERFDMTFAEYRDMQLATTKHKIFQAQVEKAYVDKDSRMLQWVGQQFGQAAKVEKTVRDETPQQAKDDLVDIIKRALSNN